MKKNESTPAPRGVSRARPTYVSRLFVVVFDIHEPHIKISNGGLTASYVAKEFYFQWGKDDKSDSGHTFEGKKFPMEVRLHRM